ncbi:MarC family protein [Thiocapsa bogorovii]|uniref:MarC family protein n=1 Tax=Thiocapsa bogorovii TaxID=521689 RepID=UPI001E5CC988|nr:MarC family protein [Thiocapsa bogorovii]UHD17788.1 MarC family protein [Thiocapsa bogorovii]
MDPISAAILLAIIMDPLGNIPVFHALLGRYPRGKRLRIIGRELAIAYLVLAFFLASGDLALRYLGLKQPALGVAGGVVLFIIALRMVFPDHEAVERRELDEEPFIVPLAIPMIAGPSALAAVLLLVSREPDRFWTWLAALTAAWVVSAAILLASGLLMEKLGPRALRALVRLTGMLLIMMAVQMLMDGVTAYIADLRTG